MSTATATPVLVTFTMMTDGGRTGAALRPRTGTKVLPSAWAAREWVAARARFSKFTHVSTAPVPQGA